ncbi:MAG: twin-arginine translocase TatA/TatE family subunit [Kiritimatiellae bacterium]|nr:twin-arginine translocase TatA/TatE family subunit [Kiritimatiellia bacterium]
MALAIIFDGVGAGEWLVLLAVLLVVMGPKRLPATARKIGSYYSKFRRAADNFKRQLMDMDYEMERAIAKAEREAEEAVNIPDITEMNPEAANQFTDTWPGGENASPAEDPSEAGVPAAGPPGEAVGLPPGGDAQPATDGDKTDQES